MQLCQNFGISGGGGFEHPKPPSPRYATGPSHLILCALVNLTISAPSINISISILFRILHILSILTGPNILLSICLLKIRRLFTVRNYLRHTRKTSQAVRNVPVLLQREPFIQGGNPRYENVSGERWGGLVKIRNERGPNTTKYNLIETNWPKQNKKRLLLAHGNYSSNALRLTNIPAIFWGIISRHFRILVYLLHYFLPKPGWETPRNARTFSLFVFCWRTLQ